MSDSATIPIFIAVVVALWPIAQFILSRSRERQFRDFKAYHRVIKELVQPDAETGKTWQDRQMAAVFELRHFPRYFEVSGRMLRGLKAKWEKEPITEKRLIEEINQTLTFIEEWKSSRWQRVMETLFS